MLYDLTTLQREANTRYGFSAQTHAGGGAALLRGAQGADLSADQLALPDQRHGRRDQADRRAGGARRGVCEGREVRDRARRAAAGQGGQRREGHRPPRDHPDPLRARPRANGLRRQTHLRHGRAAFSGGVPSRGGVREHARGDDGAGAASRRARRRVRVPHARQAPARARLARGLRGDVRRERGQDERESRGRGGRGRRPAAAEARAGRAGADARDRRARARKPNRLAATATLRCWARWRRPASSSTTTSCARR